MPWWIWTLLAIYVIGFVGLLAIHAAAVPNLTLSLMLLRSAAWPIFLVTGWPHGVPLTMD